ncbi:glutamate-1-semialdehyde-2,1-aminomutase [Desulfitobacterium hafniense DCB-2]|uniref:Glutamate-1-semialdehyde 2,1-aminomutase n=1 Tax=Desulfitobacterium hafniense (strain DSM 10664 / DCB-2) TaxID=272564 RepID=GSA_DESHD|nr:glutamate-1-semialdehyde 2,1-aminomutase [Desulfitobacterium hafniense]B8G2L6.1 RecName: Full=Glutamate-1-semialdehyde 2,1-aminomutase; Short=GSA; AltName: Full=Glutamate-1-semialdehyde aminotransferase; Short=GSA-AT [Desulfitobacterium hafniense DCB-2]ACL21366.1 glutamate-1-semialdehyde-2,1-aminomutase [Desulfitobacterium hafniense DCB-2]
MGFQDQRSKEAFARANGVLPGGVNSPVRAFKSVGREPIFIAKGQGARLWDIDGNSYLDYVLSWGPLILGHAHPVVVGAIKAAAERGTSYGAPTEIETECAEEVIKAFPSMEMVRMVSSGTEATMSALRLARGVTGRNKIIKFEGCYHGHGDSLLIKAGSGALTFGVPTSPGVPSSVASQTIVAQYNDLEGLKEIFKECGEDIAAVILEPVTGNMGVVLPQPGFLAGLRTLTQDYGSLLIFDEVMTGFRVSYGGAQGRYQIDPDLTCLGKVIGGGLPVAAYGGKRKYMEQVAPSGPIYQAGTLSGNPLAMAAGLATLKLLQQEGVYEGLEKKTARLAEGLQSIAQELGFPIWVNSVGAMFSAFFTDQPVIDFKSACSSDVERFGSFFRGMLERGIYLAPSQYEAVFLSAAHTDADIDYTLEQARDVLKSLG